MDIPKEYLDLFHTLTCKRDHETDCEFYREQLVMSNTKPATEETMAAMVRFIEEEGLDDLTLPGVLSAALKLLKKTPNSRAVARLVMAYYGSALSQGDGDGGFQ
jgi:hypothetical protein